VSGEILFISDCHLDASQPEITRQLTAFLEQRAPRAAQLYILGDLFEVWLGDDDPVDSQRPVVDALHSLARRVPVHFMAGNRDFLLGENFAARIGMRLLDEPVILQLGEHRSLLIHGDTLCTDDHDYQRFRALVRSPDWQAEFLARPLDERRQVAARLRSESSDAMAHKSAEIMDVNAAAVDACFHEHAVDTIVHGHTHRPAVHRYAGGRQRLVLGDWNPGPSFLAWKPDTGFDLHDPRV